METNDGGNGVVGWGWFWAMGKNRENMTWKMNTNNKVGGGSYGLIANPLLS